METQKRKKQKQSLGKGYYKAEAGTSWGYYNYQEKFIEGSIGAYNLSFEKDMYYVVSLSRNRKNIHSAITDELLATADSFVKFYETGFYFIDFVTKELRSSNYKKFRVTDHEVFIGKSKRRNINHFHVFDDGLCSFTVYEKDKQDGISKLGKDSKLIYYLVNSEGEFVLSNMCHIKKIDGFCNLFLCEEFSAKSKLCLYSSNSTKCDLEEYGLNDSSRYNLNYIKIVDEDFQRIEPVFKGYFITKNYYRAKLYNAEGNMLFEVRTIKPIAFSKVFEFFINSKLKLKIDFSLSDEEITSQVEAIKMKIAEKNDEKTSKVKNGNFFKNYIGIFLSSLTDFF